MQDALLMKAGDQGHPFTFDVNQQIHSYVVPENIRLCQTLSYFVLDSSSSSMLCIPSTSIRRCWQGTVTETQTCCLHCLLSLTSCVLFLQPCGVDYELKAYIANEADNLDEKIDKKYAVLCVSTSNNNSVAIRD